MYKFIFILLLSVLSGCGGSDPMGKLIHYQASPFNMPSDMVKSVDTCLAYGNTYNPLGPVESTPVLWNGEILLITGNSVSGKPQNTFRIDTFDCKTNIGQVPFVAQYMNAHVYNGTLYIYGQGGMGIIMTSSTDLITWTVPATILTAPYGMKFFNTSITQDDEGFLMAVETQDVTYQLPFVTHFARSTDFVSWSLTTDIFTDTPVSNCPWLWFNPSDRMYYIVYLNHLEGQDVTLISRSADLITWENSPRLNNLVPFTVSSGEGNNTSDVALLEHNGVVYTVYARGDQTAGNNPNWLELSTATYSGSLGQFVRLFF